MFSREISESEEVDNKSNIHEYFYLQVIVGRGREKEPWNIKSLLREGTLYMLFHLFLKTILWGKDSVQFSSVAQSCPTLCDPMKLFHFTDEENVTWRNSSFKAQDSYGCVFCLTLLGLISIYWTEAGIHVWKKTVTKGWDVLPASLEALALLHCFVCDSLF